mmetsp:Transcript_22859/g.54649  ORF Transcript_22859/g.54649 Transcript_22859/m.54649 type:complete len:302 (-) Transcript_22859:73-978(-)
MSTGQVVGKDVPAAVGLRVAMAEGQMENKGVGSITAVHANGGYCSVRWDSGLDDRCLFTGQQGDFYLALADASATTAVVLQTEAVDSSAQLHKQLLAQEVVKLRREVAQLRAEQGGADGTEEGSDALKQAHMEVARLEAQKAEIVSQATAQKALLAREVKALRSELERSGLSGAGALPGASQQTQEVANALQRRREFEENFTRTLRDLRKGLEQTSIKALSSKGQVPLGVRSLLQLSNERVDKIVEEAAQVPVEERLHIEGLRLLIENAKLRKALNEYSEGLLGNALVKEDASRKSMVGVI